MARQPKNFIKLGLVLLFLFWFFSPIVIFALDQRCWEESKCIAPETAGAFYGPEHEEVIQACGSATNAAGKKLGFCKPPYVANTEIDFGGRTSFENIGVFIKYMFRYSVMAAGILSVIMIMFAGFEWVTSGGNSEKISGAKKKISGAIMGLLIASLSYALLSTINPYLVNLRLPQAWMINTQGLAPVYCDSLTGSTKVALAYTTGEKINQNKKAELEKIATYNVDPTLAECGKEYFVKDTGAQTCAGTACPAYQLCASSVISGIEGPSRCINGMLAGTVNGAFGILQVPAVDSQNNLKLLALCKSEGIIKEVSEIDYDGNANGGPYIFSYNSKIESVCNDDGGVAAGFYLGIEVNDETSGSASGWLEGMPWTTGVDDWHAVGQTGPKSHTCTINLSRQFQKYFFSSNNCGRGNIICSCSYLSYPTVAFQAANDKQFINYFISLEDLKRGYICNIDISRLNFPSADNSVKWPSLIETLNYAAGGATMGGVAGSIFPGVGTITGAVGGAIIAPSVNFVKGFWNFVDDPTSCRDKN